MNIPTSNPPNGPRRHTERADVVIVGARCAGAATAMLLAARGHDVVLVDRSVVLGDVLSTHGISRSGVVQLHRWGLLDQILDSGAPPIRKVVFHVDGDATPRMVKARGGVDFLVAPRRQVLDSILLDAARSAGARIRTGVTVDGVHRADDGRVTGVFGRDDSGRHVAIDARVVVGADGLRSRVARAVGAGFVDVRPAASAAHYAYYRGDWDANEYIPGDGVFGGIFPTHDGEACVWVCMPTDAAERIRRRSSSLETAFTAMVATAPPQLAERLGRGVRSSAVRGMVRIPNHVRQAVGDGWTLVGDAGYHRDPITGHGISDAFRDAELLADALDDALTDRVDERTALHGYQTERDVRLREIFEITNQLTTFPSAHRFTELLKQLGRAIEHESDELAARPAPVSLAAV